MPDPIEVPWLEEGQIQARAEAFLAEQQCLDVFPVPVELIVERQGIDIFPLVGLRQNYDIDGFTSADRKMIYVDEWSSNGWRIDTGSRWRTSWGMSSFTVIFSTAIARR